MIVDAEMQCSTGGMGAIAGGMSSNSSVMVIGFLPESLMVIVDA
jgi:hypothetical protein